MKAFTALLVLVGVLAANAETTNAPGKVIAIVNAAGLKPDVLQAIKQAAEKSLNVPFETVTIAPIQATNLVAVLPAAAAQKTERYPALVMLVNATTAVLNHASYDTNTAVSIVNVTAMATDKPDVLQTRLNKQVIRGTVFAFGLPPSRDPFCVSRDYKTTDDLDKAVTVLFPPWQWRFEQYAQQKGLVLLMKHRLPRTGQPLLPTLPR